jgi:hypothetical protein
MFKVQLTASISVGKYFYDIMHFFFRMVWNKEMLYCHCFQLWSTICQYQSGMTEIVWGHISFWCVDDIYFVWEEQNSMKRSWLSISRDPTCLSFPRTVLVLSVAESSVPLYCNVLGCPSHKYFWQWLWVFWLPQWERTSVGHPSTSHNRKEQKRKRKMCSILIIHPETDRTAWDLDM